MINVTRTFLPPYDEYQRYLKEAWDAGWITNNGKLVKELEVKLRNFLKVDHLLYCNNGTIAIQVAMKVLGVTGEVITTPFSYVATTNSILWENAKPVFVDIRPDDFCIDADRIEEKITDKTTAILAVHVYGHPCDVDKIENIASRHGLKVIYDGAHAFGVEYNGKSLLSYGDLSTCSFHATKLFHTVEGGAVIASTNKLAEQVRLAHMFGHIGDDYYCLGINGKNSEFHAAMGHTVLPYVNDIIANRKATAELYDSELDFTKITKPKSGLNFTPNYGYYPVVFRSEEILLRVKNALFEGGVNTRRYFYPSLNQLPFMTDTESCPISESVSVRVLALPMFYDLAPADVKRIAAIINSNA